MSSMSAKTSASFPPSPDDLVVSCSLDGFVRWWNVAKRQLVWECGVKQPIHDMADAPTGKLYITTEELVLKTIDPQTGRIVDELRVPNRDDNFVAAGQRWKLWRTRIAVTNSTHIIFTTIDDRVCFLEPSGHLEISNRHRGIIRDLSIDSRGLLAATASSEGLLCVWNVSKGALVASFVADSDVRACSMTPDGSRVICGEISGRIHVLELKGVQV